MCNCQDCPGNEIPQGPPGENGADGADGANGTNGVDAVSYGFEISAADPGDCPCGGQHIVYGQLDNRGVLVTSISSFDICNGCDGADGEFATGDVIAVKTTYTGGGDAEWNASGLGIAARTGWAICNGNNGTDDLQGRAIFGASLTDADFAYNNPGGDKTIPILANNLPLHSHTLGGNTGANGAHTHTVANRTDDGTDAPGNVSDGGDYQFHGGTLTTSSNGSHTHSLPANTGDNTSTEDEITILPPYRAYWWIQKI